MAIKQTAAAAHYLHSSLAPDDVPGAELQVAVPHGDAARLLQTEAGGQPPHRLLRVQRGLLREGGGLLASLGLQCGP